MEQRSARQPHKLKAAGSNPASATTFVRHKRLTNDPRYWKEVVDQNDHFWIVKPGVGFSAIRFPSNLLLAIPKADYERVSPKELKGMTR